MGHEVFISYSSKDGKAAGELCRALEAGGVRVWIAPRNLPPASTWLSAIPSAIAASKVMVLVFSKHTNASEWVTREVQAALEAKKPIMTVRLVDAQPAPHLNFVLKTLHWTDAFPGAFSRHLPRITRLTQDLVGVKPKAAVVPAPRPEPAKPSAPVNWRLPAMAVAAGLGALLMGWGGVSLLSGGATTVGANGEAASATRGVDLAALADCSSDNGAPGYELPNAPWDGAYEVVDAATLKIRGRTIKLELVGQTSPGGAEALRRWLDNAGPTVTCRPADSNHCRYRCENGYHQDVSSKVLASKWAAPVYATAR